MNEWDSSRGGLTAQTSWMLQSAMGKENILLFLIHDMNNNYYHEFETVSHSIPLKNLEAYGLDRHVLYWVKN